MISADKLTACFAQFELAAIKGERAPFNGSGFITPEAARALATAGRIRIEISGQNYRVVTILVGENTGKSTAPDPSGRMPWKVLDKGGTRVNGVPFEKRRSVYLPMTRAERERRGQ